MTELYRINGEWKDTFDDEYNDKDTWIGKILVEEDGWFEGIIRNKQEEDVDVFVYGVFVPVSRIEVHAIAPYEDRLPIIYSGEIARYNYYGRYRKDREHDEYPDGDVILSTENIDGPDFLCETKELEKRIEDFKEFFLTKSKRLFTYQKARSIRDEAYKIRFKNEIPKGPNAFYEELEALFFDTHITPPKLSNDSPLDFS